MSDAHIRTCAACRKKADKRAGNFVRIALCKEGRFTVDLDFFAPGRGVYVCKTVECAEKCIKTRQLNRAFKRNVPDDVYQKLKEIIKE